MHAVLITFRSAASLEELTDDFTQYAEALRGGAAPGIISKTWLSDGATLGGFHLFRDRQAADGYLEGMFAGSVSGNPAFSDIRIERFDVADELSAITSNLDATTAGVAD